MKHQHGHKFDPKHMKNLEYLARFEEEPFELLRPLMDLATKKTIVDLGCGSGFYTFSLAHESPADAVIYALDISKEMIDRIEHNINHGEIFKPLGMGDGEKIKGIVIKEDQFPLPDASVDLFFSSKVFHEIENHERFMKEVARVMAPGGLVFTLDWKKEEKLVLVV